jgi:hypothetical protein
MSEQTYIQRQCHKPQIYDKHLLKQCTLFVTKKSLDLYHNLRYEKLSFAIRIIISKLKVRRTATNLVRNVICLLLQIEQLHPSVKHEH